jgi:hypothetical protein
MLYPRAFNWHDILNNGEARGMTVQMVEVDGSM